MHTTTTRPLGEVTVPEVEQTATVLGVDPGELLAAVQPAGPSSGEGVLRTEHVPQYCTIAEAAQLLGSRPWYVALAVERGELPAVKHEGQVLVPVQATEGDGDDQGGQCDFPGCARTDTQSVPDYSREPVVSVPLCPEHAGPQHGEE